MSLYSRNFLRIILIGDSTVGKTQILLRSTEGTFSEEAISTIGVDFKSKTLQVGEKRWTMQLWDSAGQDRFRTITESYYRRADGVAVVFDVSRTVTFKNLSVWFESLSRHATPNLPTILIGNKSDLEHEVKKSEAEEFGRSKGVPVFYTSAKTNEGIEEALARLGHDVVAHMGNASGDAEPPQPVLLDKREKKKPKSGC
jgi:small GTP-binding protein